MYSETAQTGSAGVPVGVSLSCTWIYWCLAPASRDAKCAWL